MSRNNVHYDRLTEALPVARETGDLGPVIAAAHHAVRHTVLALIDDPERLDDVVQEVWLRAASHRARILAFDPACCLTYLRRVARAVVIDDHRKRGAQKRRPPGGLLSLDSHDVPDMADPRPTANTMFELRETIADAVRMPPQRSRDVVAAVVCEGLTYKEAAAAYGCALSTVHARVAAARELWRTL